MNGDTSPLFYRGILPELYIGPNYNSTTQPSIGIGVIRNSGDSDGHFGISAEGGYIGMKLSNHCVFKWFVVLVIKVSVCSCFMSNKLKKKKSNMLRLN